MTPRSSKLGPRGKIALAWKNFHDTEHGRHAIGALMIEFGIYTSSASSDPHVLAREKGQRDVLMKIAEYVRMKPEEFVDRGRDLDETLPFEDATVAGLMARYS